MFTPTKSNKNKHKQVPAAFVRIVKTLKKGYKFYFYSIIRVVKQQRN